MKERIECHSPVQIDAGRQFEKVNVTSHQVFGSFGKPMAMDSTNRLALRPLLRLPLRSSGFPLRGRALRDFVEYGQQFRVAVSNFDCGLLNGGR